MDTLVKGMTHREMLDIMADAGIFCSVDKFARILQDAQARGRNEELERAAIAAWSTGMDTYSPLCALVDPRVIGSHCAEVIRKLKETS